MSKTRRGGPHNQRGKVPRRPSPAGFCLTPTAELAKTERAPVPLTEPSISLFTKPDDSCGRFNRFAARTAAQCISALTRNVRPFSTLLPLTGAPGFHLNNMRRSGGRRRELHPKSPLRNFLRGKVVAATVHPPVCTLSAKTRHFGSLSRIGTAWRLRSGPPSLPCCKAAESRENDECLELKGAFLCSRPAAGPGTHPRCDRAIGATLRGV
jgi:hypothetical protein